MLKTEPPFKCSINERYHDIYSINDFEILENIVRNIDVLEFWIYSNSDPMICMLKNSVNSWLMYLSESGDSGFHSINTFTNDETVEFTLSNGQIDEFPKNWCIGIDACILGIKEFIIECGKLPKSVTWIESE